MFAPLQARQRSKLLLKTELLTPVNIGLELDLSTKTDAALALPRQRSAAQRAAYLADTAQRVTADAVPRDKRSGGSGDETAVFPAMLALSATHIYIDGKHIRPSPIQRAGSESLRER